MAKYLNIDTEDQSDQYTKVILDSVVYMVRLRFSTRAGWQISFYDYDLFDESSTSNEDALIYGEVKLMPNTNALKHTHNIDTLPTGYLFLYDTEEPDIYNYEYPTQYNLGSGNRFKLVYYTSDLYDELIEDL